MLVALNNSNSPMPGSIAAALGTTAATPGNPAGGGLSADFLALLASMNVTLAPDAQAKIAAAITPFTDPVNPTTLPEMSELLEASETEKDKDASSAEDDEALAAIGLPALAITLPVTPATTTTESSESDSEDDSGGAVETLGGKPGGTATSQNTAELTSRLLTSQLLQTAAPEKLDAQLSATDASVAGDGSATASASSTTNGPNTLPAHLNALTHTQGGADQGLREIRAPVGTHAWTRQLGDELAWMAQQGRDSASLKLSPEHLGPLEVRISMREGEATVWFGAVHADTRSALEQALPRLRELFASQGLALADAGVFREAPRQQPKAPTFDSNSTRLDSVTEASPLSAVSAMATRLLDTYA